MHPYRPGTNSVIGKNVCFIVTVVIVTSECREYLYMPIKEKLNLLREHFACYTCLKPGHLSLDCQKTKSCGLDNCEKTHHPSLHQPEAKSSNYSINVEGDTICLLQIMNVPVKSKNVVHLNLFWDSRSTISLIRNIKARRLGLKGTPVTLCISTVGDIERREDSFKLSGTVN